MISRNLGRTVNAPFVHNDAGLKFDRDGGPRSTKIKLLGVNLNDQHASPFFPLRIASADRRGVDRLAILT